MGKGVKLFLDKQNRWGKRALLQMIVLIAGLFLFCGCSMVEVSEKKLRDLEYTVQCEEELPTELKEIIASKKENPFKLTFEDNGYLYICQGYGSQPTGGYSIQVRHAYVTSNAIYFSSSLIGPSEGEPRTEEPSYPYIAVKTEMSDLTVVFE